MVNAQKWLDSEFKKNRRNEIIKLDISGKNLESALVLEGFYNLKEFDCSHNKITHLDVTDSSSSLEVLEIDNNQISQLNWNFNAPANSLKILNLANNNWHNNRGIWNFSFSSS